MNGDLILEKVNNPDLQYRWHRYLSEMQKSMKKLNEIRLRGDRDPLRLEYYEAVLEFIEARDNERNYFWDAFVKKDKKEPVA